MKTLRFIGTALLTVLMSVGFSACGGSDDDGNQPSSNPLVGTWEMTDVDGDYYTLELKADGSYYQVEYEGTTEEIDRSYKGSYKILSVNGNTYEVSIFIKERYRKRKGNETVNETQTGFLTLSDNNNTMAVSGSSDIWKRKK
jgi:hypothetical protein